MELISFELITEENVFGPQQKLYMQYHEWPPGQIETRAVDISFSFRQQCVEVQPVSDVLCPALRLPPPRPVRRPQLGSAADGLDFIREHQIVAASSQTVRFYLDRGHVTGQNLLF